MKVQNEPNGPNFRLLNRTWHVQLEMTKLWLTLIKLKMYFFLFQAFSYAAGQSHPFLLLPLPPLPSLLELLSIVFLS